jgi:hypothetical protein
VSPIIDLQRSSLILVGVQLDDPVFTPHINSVSETEPYGGTTGSRHITNPVFLEQDAVGLEVKFEASVPSDHALDVYYRTASADENILDKYWTLAPETSNTPDDNSLTFRERTYLPGGRGGTLRPFNQAQVKIVFKAGSGGGNGGLSSNLMFRGLSIRYMAN